MSARDVADAFYFEMLARELERAGHEAKPEQLRPTLRLRPLDERPLAGDRPSLPEQADRVALRCALAHRLTDYHLRIDGETAEVMSWYLAFLAADGDRSMPRDEAIAMATKVARPPPDARLAVADYETMGGRTYFRARWTHEVDVVGHGVLVVEGDFIEVLINGKHRRPFSFSRRYHAPRLA